MKRTVMTLAVFALFAAPLARAQTQGEMNAETAGEFQAADKQLNSIYQKILEEYADDDAFIASLKEAQRYGSILPSCQAMYLTELTQDRTKTLQVWIDGVQEGDVCAGTVRIKPQ
jgi:uncharacterized protein YecT (DUF1311 family)